MDYAPESNSTLSLLAPLFGHSFRIYWSDHRPYANPTWCAIPSLLLPLLIPLTRMRTLKSLFALAVALNLAGCHSAIIAATISNRTSAPISLIELDYPSASFGTQTLAPGQDFHYRFQVIGSGATTILWTDVDHRDHNSSGPSLRDGDEGKLLITFDPGSASPAWSVELLNRPASGH